MTQLIEKSTRITETSESLIDLIFTSNTEKIGESGILHLSISDHSLVYAVRQTRVTRKPPRTITFRNYNKFDEKQFVEELKNVPFHVIEACDDPDTTWSIWKTMFTEVCDKHAPVVTRKVRGELCPWLTEDITKIMRERDHMHKKAIKSGISDDWEIYRSLRNKTNNCIRRSKESYYKTQLLENKNNPKGIWKLLKKLIPRKTKSPPSIMESEGQQTPSPTSIANRFNQYFSTIGSKLCNALSRRESQRPSSPPNWTFHFNPVEIESVTKQLKQLKTNKAAGLDNMPGRLLKVSAPIIAPSLTYIYNLSLSTSTFPYEWKAAKVTPLFKSGDRNLTENYRPISILPIVAKIIEKEVHSQVYAFLLEHKLLNKHQHGFRTKRSTNTALLSVIDKWFQGMDDSRVTAVVYLDLAKAFDTVRHPILIDQLSLMGINGAENDWFVSYLANRKQRVVYDGVLSAVEPITCGVPQGSALGPLLFLIYINSLPECIKYGEINMFADDTALFFTGKDSIEIERNLNADLKLISQWLENNGLVINPTKTEFMIIGTHQKLRRFQPLELYLNNHIITKVETSKYLGVTLDSNLTWTPHVDKLYSKASSRIGVLRRIRPFLDISTAKLVYSTTILPILDYCDVVWDNCNVTSSQKLQRLQNRSARIIMGTHVMTSSEVLLKQLNWDKLEERRKLHKARLWFRLQNNKMEGVNISLTCHKDVHNYNTRHKNDLKLPKPKTECLKRSFIYSGAKLWNSLSDDVKITFKL